MLRFAIAAVVIMSMTTESFAGPFGLIRRNSNTTNNTATTYNRPIAQAFLGTAQGAANYLASLGRIGHYGGNPFAYEGVGMGSTPDQALRNCCNNGGIVADYGVCQGSNGMWYACKRYHGR